LGFVDRQEFFDRFQFNDQSIGKVEIEDEFVVEHFVFVNQGQANLSEIGNALSLQFSFEAFLINRLQQAGPYLTMHFYRSPNNSMRERVPRFRILAHHISRLLLSALRVSVVQKNSYFI
jgi:hypothetical protein